MSDHPKEVTYDLNEQQSAIYLSLHERLFDLNELYAQRLVNAGLEEHQAVNTSTIAMINVAASFACTLRRIAFGQEPDPAKWRALTDAVFARAVVSSAEHVAELKFDTFVAAIQALAEKDGATEAGKPYCEAEAWRACFDEGLTAEDAWKAERDAAASMGG